MSEKNRTARLDSIMNGESETEDENLSDAAIEDIVKDIEIDFRGAMPGYCVECGDQPYESKCQECADFFCDVCYASQHRTGTRRSHLRIEVTNEYIQKITVPIVEKPDAAPIAPEPSVAYMTRERERELRAPVTPNTMGAWFIERSKYIPMRFDHHERKYLTLLESALNVCEYTDKIDIQTYSSKTKRMVTQIKELCSIISGLVLASDYKVGQALFADKNFQMNESFFQKIFEFGRRQKIMNMRNTYGKLIYMLQDSQLDEVKDMLLFTCVIPLKTVHSVLLANDALDILHDDFLPVATQEISAAGRRRSEVQYDIKQKEYAIEKIAAKYRDKMDPDVIKQCLYSIGDNHAFLSTNRDPCDKMIAYLKRYFNPSKSEPGFSLSIVSGSKGARLSHSHEKQYTYVLQSLTLWREIQHDMFKLWTFAEGDLLSESNMYRLSDTGQGMNRIQCAPSVSRLMHSLLNQAQKKVGYWVGSSVIHLGDHNVPNAFMFIDKYSQLYRFLQPVTNVLEKIEELHNKDEGIRVYIDKTFAGVEAARKLILADFFCYAFDGSGADNFFDAGSCIDGRLTSAWNWCSKLEKKTYFPLFLLTGFVGFDGQFN